MYRKQQQPFYGPLSGTTRVSQYQKKHSPTHHPDHHPVFISFFYLPQCIASSLFNLCAWQSFCTASFHVRRVKSAHKESCKVCHTITDLTQYFVIISHPTKTNLTQFCHQRLILKSKLIFLTQQLPFHALTFMAD